jgi:DtxR family Mn-dependent transcriptional regulator
VSELRTESRQPALTAAVEDYLKAIYVLETAEEAASTNALAAKLEVTPAAVSGMMRKLAALGLVEHERYHGVRLTERGALPGRESRDELG